MKKNEHASALAKKRWKGKSKGYKKAHIDKMNKARLKKMKEKKLDKNDIHMV